ncbi:MAG: hypothetical protein JXR77_13780 [Lentisphaeria bacterium]|nr:hypothetical protein [Lentisphaeria bacterium]
MANRLWSMALLAGFLSASLLRGAAGKDCYVIDSRNQKHEGMELVVKNPQGDLELNVDGRIKLPFKAGSYVAVSTPKPADVDKLEKVFEAGQYDAVAKVADPLFEKYKFLGWGDCIAYYEGMSLLRTGRAADAVKAFTKGSQFRGRFADNLVRGYVSALIEMKDTEKAQPMLARMIASERREDAAFALHSRGRVLEENGKNKEAVLEYLKVLLFFEDSSSVREYRDDARTRAVAVMKKMNDGRWKQVEDIK